MQTMLPNPLKAIYDLYGYRLEALTEAQRNDTAIVLAMSRRWAWPEILFLRFKDHHIPTELLAHLMELNLKERNSLACLIDCLARTNGNPGQVPANLP